MSSVNEANQAKEHPEKTESVVAKRLSGQAILQQAFDKSTEEIIKALPARMASGAQAHADRMIRVAMTVVRNSESLQACDPLSILGCVMQGAALGLEVDGVLGNAYMVPYAGVATFQVGYKGLINLAHRSTRVGWVDAKMVYEGDKFEFVYGTDPKIVHVPCGEWREEKITHAYAVVKRANGFATFEVWPRDRIMAHKEKFSPSQSKAESPWNRTPEPMYLKTVLRQALKYAPASTDLQYAIGMDEMGEAGVNQNLTNFGDKSGMEVSTELAAESLSSRLQSQRLEIAESVDEEVSEDIEKAKAGVVDLLEHDTITKDERAEYIAMMEVPRSLDWYTATVENINDLIASRQQA